MRKLIITLWSLALFVTTQAGDYAKYYQQLPTPVKAVVPVQIPDRQLNLVDCGGVGDGVTLCTDAFQKAIAQLAEMGGGRVLVPQGIWLTGPIELLDNIELHLDKNAIIYFSPDKRLYPNTTRRSSRVRPCIGATRRHNIAITGQGIIDGNGQQWRPVKRGKMSDVEWNLYKDMGGQVTDDGSLWYPWQMKNNYPDIADSPKKQEGMRNDLVRIEHCENVLFEGVTFQNSPRFHVHPCYCRNVILDGITVSSPWNVQNADGIDLSDCHQALIVNSTVSVGDDGLCMKSGAPAPNRLAGCQNILIDNCTVYHAHGGFVLGSETVGGVRDMVVRRCRFSGTDTGLPWRQNRTTLCERHRHDRHQGRGHRLPVRLRQPPCRQRRQADTHLHRRTAAAGPAVPGHPHRQRRVLRRADWHPSKWHSRTRLRSRHRHQQLHYYI